MLDATRGTPSGLPLFLEDFVDKRPKGRYRIEYLEFARQRLCRQLVTSIRGHSFRGFSERDLSHASGTQQDSRPGSFDDGHGQELVHV